MMRSLAKNNCLTEIEASYRLRNLNPNPLLSMNESESGSYHESGLVWSRVRLLDRISMQLLQHTVLCASHEASTVKISGF